MIENSALKTSGNHTADEIELGRTVEVQMGELTLRVLLEEKKGDGFKGRVLHVLDAKGNIAESDDVKLEDSVQFSADKIARIKED